MTRAWEAWQRFWFEPQSVAPLVLVRIAFGLLAFLWALSLLPDATTFFGPHGIAPVSPHRAGGWSVLDLWNSDFAALAVVVVLMAAALCVVFGIGTRIAAIVVFAAITSLGKRDPFIGNSGDAYIRALSFYVALAPVGAAFALGAWRRGRSLLEFPKLAPWGLRLIQIQVSLLYIGTIWAKLRGTTWPDGTAVSYAFRLDDLSRFPVPDIGASATATHVVTIVVLVIEASLGVLVWSRRLRPWVLLAGVLLHLGIEYRLRVGFFSWAVLVGYLAFVPPAVAERFLGGVVRLRSRRWRVSGSTP